MRLDILSLLSTVFILVVGLHNAYSIPELAPGPNTIDTYCSSGTCVTPSNFHVTANNNTDLNNAVNYLNGTSPSIYGIPLSHSQLIGVQLSQSCVKMEEQHIKSDCPTYDKLFFLDNTNIAYSGQWINDTWYHRQDPKISTIFASNVNKYVVMVDPDAAFTTRAKMIIIQPNNFIWINPDQTTLKNTNTLIQHINRFVITPCEGATVAPDLWLINDTVRYLENGCTITAFNDTKIIQRATIPFSYDNPFSSLHYYNYLKSIYHTGFSSVNETGGSGLGDCIHHKCNFVDPFAKAGW